MATRSNPAPEPSSEPPAEGFTEGQRAELRALIAEAVGSAKAPTPEPSSEPKGAKGPPQVSDAQWDVMSDRQRESYVRQIVDFRLDELARDDEIRAQRSELEKLKADKTPEPEDVPGPISKIQAWLWGDAKAKV